MCYITFHIQILFTPQRGFDLSFSPTSVGAIILWFRPLILSSDKKNMNIQLLLNLNPKAHIYFKTPDTHMVRSHGTISKTAYSKSSIPLKGSLLWVCESVLDISVAVI